MILAQLTYAQRRILVTLADSGRWMSLIELERLWSCEADDVLVVPSLLEDGLVEHRNDTASVRITRDGYEILNPRRNPTLDERYLVDFDWRRLVIRGPRMISSRNPQLGSKGSLEWMTTASNKTSWP